MKPESAQRLRVLSSIAGVLAALAVIAAGWYYWRIRASLPQLDGQVALSGLGAAVTIERDANGVPTIRGANRVDVARGLGFLHGQDRFFQMDLLRRSPAGELAVMFGRRALPRDRAMRMHGFRKIAQQAVATLSADQQAVLEAYTAGVNAGLAALREQPFEYLLLREVPQPWQPEDSILVIYAMTIDLQDESGRYERTLMTLRNQFGAEALAFFAPLAVPDDAALDGSTAPIGPIPGPEVIDLRATKVGATRPNLGARLSTVARSVWRPWTVALPAVDPFPFPVRDEGAVLGSNAFALSGAHTASGGAMLANDMHLDHGVPNIWYRVSMEYAGVKVTGVTLPGTPALAAGSNGHVAWGLTDAYADTGDLVVIEATPGGSPVRIEERTETIRIKGALDAEESYSWTALGPLVGVDGGKPLVYRWVPHDPRATNLSLLEMEAARDIQAALAVAHRSGIPAVNLLLADREGAIAWTIAGRLPKRSGYDGRLPTALGGSAGGWDGYLMASEVPVVLHPAKATPASGDTPSANGNGLEGRLWSANNRMIGGTALARIGDGGYPRPNRAAQLRDGLAGLEQATPKDLLALQLDDRALFLAPWHELMMKALTPAVAAEKKGRGTLRSFAEKWEGRASVEAVSYRVVREFRSAVYLLVFPPIFAPCVETFPDFRWQDLQLEGALWTMLREQPPHLLNPAFQSWEELLVMAIDDVITNFDKQGMTLPHANWGWRNTARIRHPFSGSFPWLANWLDMPQDPLPGDSDMPRVQGPGHGASERMIVTPGREAEGIFHMPGGQSGHPMSPFYRAGHGAWVRGEPTPFLPGKTIHTLTLVPE